MTDRPLNQLNVLIKGAGEMATGIACRLYRARIHRIVMAEIKQPLAVRRAVSFCEAVYDGHVAVESIKGTRVVDEKEIHTVWKQEGVAVIIDPDWQIGRQIEFDVVIDATIAKTNLGTSRDEAPLVIGLGPGLRAGSDVHQVIETNRGHNIGRIIDVGEAEANTGIPGEIDGYTSERVLRAPCDGRFSSDRAIGDLVKAGDPLGQVAEETINASIDGVIRGLIRPGSIVRQGLKIGDIDPRGIRDYCFTISDKARSLGGAVLEAILGKYNM